MKQITIFFTLLFVAQLTFAQTYATYNVCDSLTFRQEIPTEYNSRTNTPLTPAPCSAKSNYNTMRLTVLYPQNNIVETKYKVKLITETILEGCTETVVVVSRDTVDAVTTVIEAEKQYAAQVWTIRMELLTYVPNSRPNNSFVVQIPEGPIKGYYVTYYGEYNSQAEAKTALQAFKRQYPEFCQAYVWQVPARVEVKYSFVTKQFNSYAN